MNVKRIEEIRKYLWNVPGEWRVSSTDAISATCGLCLTVGELAELADIALSMAPLPTNDK